MFFFFIVPAIKIALIMVYMHRCASSRYTREIKIIKILPIVFLFFRVTVAFLILAIILFPLCSPLLYPRTSALSAWACPLFSTDRMIAKQQMHTKYFDRIVSTETTEHGVCHFEHSSRQPQYRRNEICIKR